MWRTRAAAAFALVTVWVACAVPARVTAGATNQSSPPASVVIAAAGDIACTPGSAASLQYCDQQATSDLLVNGHYNAVLTLGDNQYDHGLLSEFQGAYDSSWGRVKAITDPSVGNHEYDTEPATGYFSYFGSVAGNSGQGWYSYNLGAWHLIALNSNCALVGGCNAGSPQETWLRQDLMAHPNTCILAYWHHPRWSSGSGGDQPVMQDIWADLYAAHAAVALTAHEHDYERFAPQNAGGGLDTSSGITEFVVGTGGDDHHLFSVPAEANEVVRNDTSFGILQLTLNTTGYSYKFIPVSGATFTDSGSGTCPAVGATTSIPTSTPTPPATTTAPTLTASPNSVPAGSSSSTVIWNTGGTTAGEVYVSVNGAADQLFASGVSGTAVAPWITPGYSYQFKLYASTTHTTQLASVTVTSAGTPAISASPSSVPVLPGTSSGPTTITWNTNDGTSGQVYVSVDGGADQLFASGASGAAIAPWITQGYSYVFKLYAGTGHTTQLASTIVTAAGADAPGAITAGANPAPVSPGSKGGPTSITWNTGTGAAGEVYVSVDGGADQWFASGSSGSITAPWITKGYTYIFKLYAGTSHKNELAAAIVTAAGGSAPAAITAGPNPVTVGLQSVSGATTITWNTENGATGDVYVSVNGGTDQLFASGASGSAIAPWITRDYIYTFKLYAGTGHTTLLGSATVTATVT